MTDTPMTQDELEADAAKLTNGSEVETLETEAINRLVTVGQYLTDRCAAELERRGELPIIEGNFGLPYVSEHSIECFLTRPNPGAHVADA